ncbi:MAG: hypothetical protein CSA52_02330 [Gammaproteobacteria bacterium]|nr:MAG: hypothetical protein CSB48_06315 [Pseudomonadota bacterium]PIE38427.1 MAG: hypothetical protein CSA52_02330 [Gammaproteobacteria bacterium]
MKKKLLSTILQAIVFYALPVIATSVLLYYLVIWLRLIPPQSVTMAAGKPGSAYHEVAVAYQKVLAEDGITLKIIETAGSAENRDLMDNPDGKADIALIQGGITSTNPELNALAAVFPEPLLTFARSDKATSGNPGEWDGYRVATGSTGGGTRAVVQQLAHITGVPALSSDSDFNNQEASEALVRGDLDIAFFVAPLSAPYLQPLYNSTEIKLLPLQHARALANQLPEARWIELYGGAIRYSPAYPPETVPLITMVTKLVARDNLHPALVNRLVRAMIRVHMKPGPLVMDYSFPNTELLDMKADIYSAKLLREGFSPLESFIPYWMAAQINRFAILLLPIVFLLLPLFKVLPALVAWRMRARVYRYYDRLHEIDLQLSDQSDKKPDKEEREKLSKELEEIEAGLRDESLPLRYREQAYIASGHVGFVRRKLQPNR